MRFQFLNPCFCLHHAASVCSKACSVSFTCSSDQSLEMRRLCLQCSESKCLYFLCWSGHLDWAACGHGVWPRVRGRSAALGVKLIWSFPPQAVRQSEIYTERGRQTSLAYGGMPWRKRQRRSPNRNRVMRKWVWNEGIYKKQTGSTITYTVYKTYAVKIHKHNKKQLGSTGLDEICFKKKRPLGKTSGGIFWGRD